MSNRRFVDLSIFLENEVVSDPEPYRPKIDYIDHKQTIGDLVQFFPGMSSGRMPGIWCSFSPASVPRTCRMARRGQ